MKILAITALAALSLTTTALTTAIPAFAGNTKPFVSSLQQVAGPIKIEVIFSEDLAYRADHNSQERRDRHNRRTARDGFGGHGFYGQRDLDGLAARMERRLTFQFKERGIEISDAAATVLTITIDRAEPSRPTFKQLSQDVSLSSRSYATGGASFQASLSGPGAEYGSAEYSWYESDIRQSSYGATWRDANRAIDRFARKTAKAIR